MSIIFDRYTQQDVGKFFKDSKRSHEWIVTIHNKKNKIVIKESYSSKRFRFFFNDKLISEFITKEEDKKKGFDFQVDNLSIHVKRGSTQRELILYINNQLFTQGTVKELNDISPIKKTKDEKIKTPNSNRQDTQKLTQDKHDRNIQLSLGEVADGEPEGFDDFEKK